MKYSVRQFIEWAGLELGAIVFEGEGLNETGIVKIYKGSNAPGLSVEYVIKVDQRYLQTGWK